jgi:membrane fusion protein
MSNEPLYRIVVELDRDNFDAYGQIFRARSGSSVDAQIIQESRSLFEWLLEPVFAMRGQLLLTKDF